ncbi:MAG: MoaD/ThiS family protein [Candidatus Thorarchaeota archaeon]
MSTFEEEKIRPFQLTIRLFASIREIVGKDTLIVNLDKATNLDTFLIDFFNSFHIMSKFAQKIKNKEHLPYLIILNGQQITSLTNIVISARSELAILPPIGGG